MATPKKKPATVKKPPKKKRVRDYKKEHERSNELERQRGYPNRTAAHRARKAGTPLPTDDIPKVRKSRARQVFPNMGGRTMVSTTPNGKGLWVVESRLRNLPADTPVTINVTMMSGPQDSENPEDWGRINFMLDFNIYGRPLTAGDLQGVNLRQMIADLVTVKVTDSGKAHHRPGAPVQAFEADDVCAFDISWSNPGTAD